jgi:alpha-beta hydrolase superfamily lysophospholipase
MEAIDVAVVARKTVAEFIREYPDVSQRQFLEKAIQDWLRRDPEVQALWNEVRELRAEIKSLRAVVEE